MFLASAFLAAHTAGAMMIAAAWGRTILPVGEYRKSANVPGKRPLPPLAGARGLFGRRALVLDPFDRATYDSPTSSEIRRR